MAKLQPASHAPEAVEAFLGKLEHPLWTEVQSIRECVKGVHPEITEQVKWNAPSFGFRGEYLFTFHLRPQDHLHLVFHNRRVMEIGSPILEGSYTDGRRMTYFKDAAEFAAKREEFERVIRILVDGIGNGG